MCCVLARPLCPGSLPCSLSLPTVSHLVPLNRRSCGFIHHACTYCHGVVMWCGLARPLCPGTSPSSKGMAKHVSPCLKHLLQWRVQNRNRCSLGFGHACVLGRSCGCPATSHPHISARLVPWHPLRGLAEPNDREPAWAKPLPVRVYDPHGMVILVGKQKPNSIRSTMPAEALKAVRRFQNRNRTPCPSHSMC